MEQFHKRSTLPTLAPSLESGLPSKQNSAQHQLPETIGPYKVESFLGQGGMSLLYLSHAPITNLPVVLKVLPPQSMSNPALVARFLKEAKIIALANHKNLLTLYGQGEWEGGLYIATEFIQGISLTQFILHNHLATLTTLNLVLQIAYALLHLHSHGVIHRDLKPENILITDNGQIKLIDFGIAQLHHDEEDPLLKEAGHFLGTPTYMSPEQRKNPLEVTPATDIYALGILTFELLVGQLTAGSVELSLIPSKLRRIIEKSIAPNLKHRYQDVVELIADMSAYMKQVASPSGEESPHTAREVWQSLSESHLRLLPDRKRSWPHCQVSLALSAHTPINLFYDFSQLADQSYLILLGESQSPSVNSLTYVGMLKGIVQTAMQPYLKSETDPFHPISFISELNQLLNTYAPSSLFSLALIYLQPFDNRLSSILCGSPPLIHLPGANSHLRVLTNTNPLLGKDPYHTFYETDENWNEGDQLFCHNLSHDHDQVEQLFDVLLHRYPLLAIKTQAHNLLSDLKSELPHSPSTSSDLLLALHRIA